MKTKALISFAVTAKLVCVFVFVYAKSRFSHDEAHLVVTFFLFFKFIFFCFVVDICDLVHNVEAVFHLL